VDADDDAEAAVLNASQGQRPVALPPAPVSGFRTLGHGTVVVDGPPRLAVDPWRWREPGVVRVVLLTDGAIDHCSEEDILAAGGGDAAVICPAALVARLSRSFPGRVAGLREGDTWTADGAVVRALPARAVARAGGFLRRGEGLTYLVECAGARWLFLGASDALPEHEGLAPDAAFFAVGDFTTPTPGESADAAARVRPGLAVPTHWGDLAARFDAARRFASLCEPLGVRAIAVRGVRDGDSSPD
jgi:L-ascorbate metabolism protein UlaG (beta-lactamase superfamily)